MKKLVLTAACAVIWVPAAACAEKIGPAVVVIVDTDRILRDCMACVAAQAQLRQQAEQIRKRVEQLDKPLDAEVAALRAQMGGKAPTPAQRNRIDALEAKQARADQEIAAHEQTFERNRAFVGQQVSAKLMPIIKQVMNARRANIALDAKAALSFAPGLDVTAQVLAALDKQLSNVSATAPASTGASDPGR